MIGGKNTMDIFSQIVLVIGRIQNNMINMLGTCFSIKNGKYIVVPRHVIGDSDENLSIILPSMTSISEYQDTTTTRCAHVGVKIVATDPFRNISILQPIIPIRMPEVSLGDTDDLKVMDQTFIVGFPHCTEGRKVLTIQEADVGAKILLETNNIKSKYIVVNTQTRPGQSGSLIYNSKNNKIVAMLIGAFAPESGISLGGINPRELHQTTHCISAEYISNMIKENEND